jgi:DNA-binding response OmpR family regulator
MGLDGNLGVIPGLKVMVVEDERDIRDILKNLLQKEGFEVIALSDGKNLIQQLELNTPDLILLDRILPGKDGIDALGELRSNDKFSHLPVIMVTGLSGESDKVAAFERGADDYITKPFFPKELTARIKALARRALKAANDGSPLRERLSFQGVTVDFSEHRAWVGDGEISLTLTEFKILGELLKQNGQVLTRERLREKALGNLNVTDRTIDVHMASLRKKLGPIGKQVETVRGVGYRLAEPRNDDSGFGSEG